MAIKKKSSNGSAPATKRARRIAAPITLTPARLTTEADGTVKAWYLVTELLARLDPTNARQHGPRDLEAQSGSLAKFKQQKPVVLDADYVVRAGNGTVMAAARSGVELVWAVRGDLRGEEATQFALADNRIAELSYWDSAGLAAQLAKFHASGQDVAELGWAEHELETVIAAAAKLAQMDSPPEEFKEYGADIPIAHTCPKCGYEWSGGK